MGLFSCFEPEEYVDAYGRITPEFLKERGIRGVIFDIDNTLVPQDAPITAEVLAYFELLHRAGIKTFFLSNNSSESRVADFAEATGSGFLSRAKKPRSKGYIKAIRRMRTGRRSTLVVGDQLFTDIYGARRLRIPCVLVAPVAPEKDCASVRLKRPLEKLLFRIWKRKNT